MLPNSDKLTHLDFDIIKSNYLEEGNSKIKDQTEFKD